MSEAGQARIMFFDYSGRHALEKIKTHMHETQYDPKKINLIAKVLNVGYNEIVLY